MENKQETKRIELFSDAVFAIAITLLVLELISAVHGDGESLFGEILHKWPIFLAFFTSFFTIGVMWLNHHRLFTHITRSDHMLLILNLLVLLVVTIVPFSTAVIGEMSVYMGGTRFQQEAAMLYSGTFIAVAVVFFLLWYYATYKQRLLDPNVDERSIKKINRQYMFGPLLYCIAFGLTFVDIRASLGLNAFLAVFFALPGIELQIKKRTNAHLE